jgi:hypothetical protein
VLELDPATLTGSVLRERDSLAPIEAAGVLVTLDTGVTTTTDAAGTFTFTGLPAGTRRARLELANYDEPCTSKSPYENPAPEWTMSLRRQTPPRQSYPQGFAVDRNGPAP